MSVLGLGISFQYINHPGKYQVSFFGYWIKAFADCGNDYINKMVRPLKKSEPS